MKKPQTEQRKSLAAKSVIQILFASTEIRTIEGLREKLRECFKDDVRPEHRAVASLSTVELITALLDANKILQPAGLQLHISNGTVQLLTTRVDNSKLADYLQQHTQQTGNPSLSTASLEVLAAIAFKQPISQTEINSLFATDKRHCVEQLRALGLVEGFAGVGGRIHFSTTAAFLRRFDLSSIGDLTPAMSR